MPERDLNTMSLDELYAFKDRLKARRDRIKGRRGPGPSHTRHYCRTMRDKINAELKRRDAPLRPLDAHQRMHGPGAAPWQKDGGK